MPPRRSLPKRVGLYTAAAVLGLACYVVGAPIVVCLALHKVPSALPVLKIVYTPLDAYLNADLPGSDAFITYAQWCKNEVDEYFL